MIRYLNNAYKLYLYPAFIGVNDFTICINDYCDRPIYCDVGTFAANPDDCTKYYLCNHGAWLVQYCHPSTKFDIVTCGCNFTQYVECAWCNNTEPDDVTILPGI